MWAGWGSYLPVQDLRLATEEAVAVVTAQVNAPFRACALEGRKTSKGGARSVWWWWGGEVRLVLCSAQAYLPQFSYPLYGATPFIPGLGSEVPGTWSSSWGCRIGRLCDRPCCSNRGQRGCGGRSCRVGEGLGHREKGRAKEREEKESTEGVR